MPVINFSFEDFSRLSKLDLTPDEFLEIIPQIGADVDKVSGDELAVEFFPDRPDLFSVEGVARAMRAFTGRRPGLVEYAVAPPKIALMVEPAVVPVRPFVVAGVVRGVELDEAAIIALMELQEKLHLTLGRKRRKVSIGVHDMTGLDPPFRYTAVAPHEVSFVPLQETRKMDLAAILNDHPKGRDYAHLLEGFDHYPVIFDAQDRVLSFPPIINSTLTTVSARTTDIFLDVTGLDLPAVTQALNIVAAALVERGGSLEGVELTYPDEPALGTAAGRTCVTPDMTPRTWRVSPAYLSGLLGWEPETQRVVGAFKRMGLDAGPTEGGELEVRAPAYRNDLLHSVDLVEEAAIGLGYLNSPESLPRAMTFGRSRKATVRAEAAAEALMGLGFMEVVTLTLSGPVAQFERMGQTVAEGVTRLDNPIGAEYSLLRSSLLPGMLEVLAANTHRELPQRLFEVGPVVCDHANVPMMGFVALEARANFSQAKGIAQALLNKLGLTAEIEAHDHPGFIPGRCAKATVEGRRLGHFGEIAPRVILNWELAHPLIAGEFELP